MEQKAIDGALSLLRIVTACGTRGQHWEKMIARHLVFFDLSSSKRSLSNSSRILMSRFEAGRRLQQRSGVLLAPSLL